LKSEDVSAEGAGIESKVFIQSPMKSTIPAHVYKSGPAVIGVDLISGVRPGSSYSMLVPLREMTKKQRGSSFVRACAGYEN
jgi:hypothetical protein